MKTTFSLDSMEDYRRFLAVKSLPSYRIVGRSAEFPDIYADRVGGLADASHGDDGPDYRPLPGLFDYQEAIVRMAIDRRKFAVFAEPGLGKTLILLEYARHVLARIPPCRKVLIVSPLMVVAQTIAESLRFYDGFMPERVPASRLASWMADPGAGRFGITNYDALSDSVDRGLVDSLILDESSMLKSHYGKHGAHCLRIGAGMDWKLCLTGTPAPNDRIEYANHAVFLDAFPNVNSFLAKFFVNRGQTGERWELKPHALTPFYRAISHWAIFLTNPATYGWTDNVGMIPPIRTHIHDVRMTAGQSSAVRALTGEMFVNNAGGIGNRSRLARIAKGGDSAKPAYIRDMVESWPDESTLIWCRFNEEQDTIAGVIPGSRSISGSTAEREREQIIDDFKAGRARVLVTKPKILGFGLNLQVATRQIFSSLHDSYEEYFQAVKRSNRVGSTKPLDVHIPITDAERPMAENVLRKADMVGRDTEEQERIFLGASRWTS